MSTTRSR